MNRLPTEQLRKYFRKPPGIFFSIFLILIGTSAIGLAIASDRPQYFQMAAVFGGLLILIGIIRLFRRLGGRLSDSEIDKQFQNDQDELVKHALDKVGLDESELSENKRKPLILMGPILWATEGVSNKDLVWKKGKDGIVRFGVNRITIIYFSKNLLASFACDFNFLKNVTLNERTDEYYYKDIVSVSTSESSTSYTLPNGTKLTHSQEFRLSISNGEAIRVFIDSGKLTKITDGNIPTEEAEKAVQVIRTILKDKKQ